MSNCVVYLILDRKCHWLGSLPSPIQLMLVNIDSLEQMNWRDLGRVSGNRHVINQREAWRFQCLSSDVFQLTLAFPLKSKLVRARKGHCATRWEYAKYVITCDQQPIRASQGCAIHRLLFLFQLTLPYPPQDACSSFPLISDVAQCQITRRQRGLLLLTISCHCRLSLLLPNPWDVRVLPKKYKKTERLRAWQLFIISKLAAKFKKPLGTAKLLHSGT